MTSKQRKTQTIKVKAKEPIDLNSFIALVSQKIRNEGLNERKKV